MSRTNLDRLALALVCLVGGDAALAGATSGANQTISVTVAPPPCVVTSPANFTFASTAGVQSAPAAVQHALSVNCPFGTFFSIGFVSPNDADATGVTKKMVPLTPGNTDSIAYQLQYGGTPVGKQDGVNTVFGFSFGFTQTYAISATIKTWSGSTGGVLRADTYQDIVTTRVDF